MGDKYTPTTHRVVQSYVAHNVERKDWLNGKLVGAAGAEFDRWHEEEKRKARAEGWREGYDQGVVDERTAEALSMNENRIPNRMNPHEVLGEE